MAGTPFILIPGLVISSVYWVPLAECLSQSGPVFAVEGGLDGWLRLPYTKPESDLHDAVRAMTTAWHAMADEDPREHQHPRAALIA